MSITKTCIFPWLWMLCTYLYSKSIIKCCFLLLSSENKVKIEKVADICFTVKLCSEVNSSENTVCPSDEGGCNGEEFSLYF